MVKANPRSFERGFFHSIQGLSIEDPPYGFAFRYTVVGAAIGRPCRGAMLYKRTSNARPYGCAYAFFLQMAFRAKLMP